jgi:ABC-type nitrate/sulfonate/bicarbonate transport system ATPase subunit
LMIDSATQASSVHSSSGGRWIIEARDISHTFKDGDGHAVRALDDVSLAVAPGEFASIIGPSGAGKSTLLNILAGLDTPSHGKIWLNGHATTTRERLGQVGLMPQRDLLLPWRTALGNAVAGLEVRGTPRSEALEQAQALFDRFGLADFAGTYPYALSGGMRQRVALIRSALAAGPILLLDEPFGALDAITRAEMHRWLTEMWQEMRQSILLVTHDINEALILSDRIFVLSSAPGHVRAELRVDLPRPRDAEVQAGGAFGDLRRQALAAMEGRS